MATETIETMLALRRWLEQPDATEADVVALLHRDTLPLRTATAPGLWRVR